MSTRSPTARVSGDKDASPVSSTDDIALADEEALRACGYKQEFKREFSLFSTFSVSFSVLGILPSIAATLSFSLGYAGTVGLTWRVLPLSIALAEILMLCRGWLVAWTGIQCVATSMAELASSMPTSGGLYYAVGVLAPPGWGPFLAYLTGWSNWIGLSTASPSVNYGNAAMIVALVKLHNPDFEATNARVFGITLSLTFLCFVCATLPTRWLARINSAMTWFQSISYLVIVIGLPAAVVNRPRFRPTHEVWGTISNGTQWPDGIAVLLSFLTAIWTMAGYDAPFHLSEECSNSQIATPRAIVSTAAFGGIFGWFLVMVFAYVITDVGAVLQSPLGQPFIATIAQATTPAITTAFGTITVICGIFCAQGCAISCSRLAFAYARDGLLPASRLVSRVNRHTSTPVNACIFNFIANTAHLCLIFAGPIAVGAIFSAGAVGAYFAFIMPVFLRCFFAGDRWRPGPWNLGRWGKPVGYYACAYVSLMLPILCFPAVRGADLTAQTMNWTIVVWGGPLSIAAVYFALVARKTYKGPQLRGEHLSSSHGRADVTRDEEKKGGRVEKHAAIPVLQEET
ncbi:amino acid permease [Exidia glandulosa HHB12029]|uniref:Amino acid permease n=1 Tax=Exidia glandulosa HHB12029 TaxID=1314781 RepID=A0A165ZRR5_EXIGL|nr:amino acid permease [Exidia glandulosa HHB12029]